MLYRCPTPSCRSSDSPAMYALEMFVRSSSERPKTMHSIGNTRQSALRLGCVRLGIEDGGCGWRGSGLTQSRALPWASSLARGVHCGRVRWSGVFFRYARRLASLGCRGLTSCWWGHGCSRFDVPGIMYLGFHGCTCLFKAPCMAC
jgi:hypothetical protein